MSLALCWTVFHSRLRPLESRKTRRAPAPAPCQGLAQHYSAAGRGAQDISRLPWPHHTCVKLSELGSVPAFFH
jgi:hypothetical protein